MAVTPAPALQLPPRPGPTSGERRARSSAAPGRCEQGPPGAIWGVWVQPPQAEHRSRSCRGVGRGCRASREPGRGHPALRTHHLLCERGRQCSHLRALGTSGSTNSPAPPPTPGRQSARAPCTPRVGLGQPEYKVVQCWPRELQRPLPQACHWQSSQF